MPPIDVIRRFANAIGAPVEVTARAFAADMNIPLDVPVPNQAEHQLLAAFRVLPPDIQQIATTLVTALVAHTQTADGPEQGDTRNNVSGQTTTPVTDLAERVTALVSVSLSTSP